VPSLQRPMNMLLALSPLHLHALLSPERCSRGEADLNVATWQVQGEDVALEQKATWDWQKTGSSREWRGSTRDALSAGPPCEADGLNSPKQEHPSY